MAFSGSSIAAALALVASPLAQAQDYVISTYAGGAPPPTPVAGVTASIGEPLGVATDAAGNVYFSSYDECVFKLETSGVLTLVAGNSRPGYSGDGGPATRARLDAPQGVAVDGAGNVYIADTGNNRIRKVSPAGIISTVAGNGTQGYSGDGGPATSAQLDLPEGVAVDGAGNLYIADASNCRVRKVSPAGIITTIAGNGMPRYFGDGGPAASAGLAIPWGLAVDGAGNLYIADTGNNRIRKVSPAGIISTVAGNGVAGFSGDGGAATSAELQEPSGVAVDGAGNLYIADIYRIRKVSPEGIISTVVGSGALGYSGDGGPATGAELQVPSGVAVDGAGNLYIADTDNNRIRKVSPEGIISTVAGNGAAGYFGDGGFATGAQLNGPAGVAVDSVARVFIADTGNNAIRLVMPRWLAPIRRRPDVP